MIRIGFIVEGWRDRAFLHGLAKRDGWCPGAQLLEGRYPGRGRASLHRELAKTCKDLLSKRADFIVVLLDADGEDWLELKRRERERVPAKAKHCTVLGVTVDNVEDWLNADPHYLAGKLAIPLKELQVGGSAKAALDRVVGALVSFDREERIVALVQAAPLKRWIQSSRSFAAFYDDARDMAKQSRLCEIPNERGD